MIEPNNKMLKPYGYAMGGYLVPCEDCEMYSQRDKRSTRCRRCAVAAWQKDSTCQDCNGSGRTSNHVTGEVECSTCEGTGMNNEHSEKFIYDQMEFELWSDSTKMKAIEILGKKPKLILFSLPESTTVDQARYMVTGYFAGVKDGQREVIQAVRQVQNNDLKRAYYVEENTNGQ